MVNLPRVFAGVIKNRIARVGPFSYGPANQLTLCLVIGPSTHGGFVDPSGSTVLQAQSTPLHHVERNRRDRVSHRVVGVPGASIASQGGTRRSIDGRDVRLGRDADSGRVESD